MDIEIGNYKLVADANSFNVLVKSDPKLAPKPKEGAQPKWTVASYHGRAEQALMWILNHKLRASDFTSLKEVAEAIVDFKNEVKALVGVEIKLSKAGQGE